MSEHHWTPRVVPILGSTDYHLAASLLPDPGCAVLPVLPVFGRSGRLWPAVEFAADHHRPGDARHLVGQRHRRDFLWLACQQSAQPRRGAALLDGLLDERGGAQDQQLAQTLVTGAADFAEPLPAGGRVLARCDPDPRGKVPARA